MKRRNLKNTGYWFAGIGWLAFVFSSCTAEMAGEPYITEGTPVTIRAEIDTTRLVTRATGVDSYDPSSFSSNDQICIIKTRNGSTKSVYYKMNTSSEWEVVGNDPITLQIGAQYQAKYPFNYSGIKTNQSTAADYRASNYLLTKNITSSNGVLDFTGEGAFAHQNTKITLSFTGSPALSTATSNFTDFSISATGLRTGGTNAEQITFFHLEESKFDWCGIVYPQNKNVDITLSLTYNKVTYKAKITCPTAAGTHYKYTLTLKNNLLVPTGTEIEGWTDNTVHTGDFTTN